MSKRDQLLELQSELQGMQVRLGRLHSNPDLDVDLRGMLSRITVVETDLVVLGMQVDL